LLIANQAAFQALCTPKPESRLFNIAAARLFLQAYGLTIKLNEMNRRTDIDGLPQKYAGEDSANLLEILITDAANNLGYKRATSLIVHDALFVVANENRYHPVLELLDSAPWDGYDRRPEIYRMLGLTDQFYITLVHKWSLQTIAVLQNTALNPIAAQGVLTFQGFQGIGKTQFLRHLAIRGDFFKEGATLDMSNKDTLMSALKVWICELGELDSTTKKEQSALKAFLTQTTDSFREPYARNETVRPRRTAFCGSVNPQGFLRDETGNRRYWTVPVNNIDLGAVFYYQQEWYVQYWRQILYEYRSNPQGYLLTAQENDMVNANNEQFEAEAYGESEFITMYDISIDPKYWGWMTAAQIAQSLNEAYKHLNISSEGVSQRLLPRICKRIGHEVQRKRGTEVSA
jgi:predicted P-loop ATPase